jgi:hypothetical protein
VRGLILPSKEQIRALWDEAAKAGDDAMATICEVALSRDGVAEVRGKLWRHYEAMQECARVISEQEAQSNGHLSPSQILGEKIHQQVEISIGRKPVGRLLRPLRRWRVTSSAGVVLGVYEGADRVDAMRAMARDAGYRDEVDAESAAGAFDGTIEEVK